MFNYKNVVDMKKVILLFFSLFFVLLCGAQNKNECFNYLKNMMFRMAIWI